MRIWSAGGFAILFVSAILVACGPHTSGVVPAPGISASRRQQLPTSGVPSGPAATVISILSAKPPNSALNPGMVMPNSIAHAKHNVVNGDLFARNGMRPFSGPVGSVYWASIQLQPGQQGGEVLSYPSGTFDPNCGSLIWAVTGLPAGVTASFSPQTGSPTTQTTLTINAGSSTAFGVTTFSYTATCTGTGLTGTSSGGASQTFGLYEVPPVPVASAISITVAQGQTGHWTLTDSASAIFSPLEWQAWGFNGLTWANASTNYPFSNVLSVSVSATASPGAYGLDSNVSSNVTYGQGDPVTIYLSVVTPNPSASPTPSPSPKPSLTPSSSPTSTSSSKPTTSPSPKSSSSASASPTGAPTAYPTSADGLPNPVPTSYELWSALSSYPCILPSGQNGYCINDGADIPGALFSANYGGFASGSASNFKVSISIPGMSIVPAAHNGAIANYAYPYGTTSCSAASSSCSMDAVIYEPYGNGDPTTVSGTITYSYTQTDSKGNVTTASGTQYILGSTPGATPSPKPSCNAAHITVATSPSNQNRLTIGIDEVVSLSSSNGTSWSASGAGSLTLNNGSVAKLTANQTAGTAAVTISGANCTAATITFSVIVPSGLNYQRVDSNVDHTHSYGDVGIQNNVYLLPATVSFANLGYGELNATNHATGTWACLNGTSHNPNPTMISGGDESGSLGTPVGIDTAYSGYCNGTSPTITSSTTYFNIPDVYEINGNTAVSSGLQFINTLQTATMTSNGTMTMQKGNSSAGQTSVSAPSEGY